MESKIEQTVKDHPEFPDLTDLAQQQLIYSAEQELGRIPHRPSRRFRRQNPGVGHSKHSRRLLIDGELVKVHMTKQRPWVRKAISRKRSKIATASRRRNRA